MDRTLLVLSGAMGFLGVALGAFGAHGLKRVVEPLADGAQRMAWWATAAQYHLVHALAIGLVAAIVGRTGAGASAGYFFVAGTLLFSGSLYAMTLTGVRALGAVTPLGGLCFLVGWALIVRAAVTMPA